MTFLSVRTALDAVIGTYYSRSRHANTDIVAKQNQFGLLLRAYWKHWMLGLIPAIITLVYGTKMSNSLVSVTEICCLKLQQWIPFKKIHKWWDSKVLGTHTKRFWSNYPETYTSAKLYPDIYTHRYSPCFCFRNISDCMKCNNGSV